MAMDAKLAIALADFHRRAQNAYEEAPLIHHAVCGHCQRLFTNEDGNAVFRADNCPCDANVAAKLEEMGLTDGTR